MTFLFGLTSGDARHLQPNAEMVMPPLVRLPVRITSSSGSVPSLEER